MDALARLRYRHERWHSLVTNPESRYADLSKAEADLLDELIDTFPALLAELAAARETATAAISVLEQYRHMCAERASTEEEYLAEPEPARALREALATQDAARRATDAAMGGCDGE